jgi:uncharacterized protein (TIGR02145 family)
MKLAGILIQGIIIFSLFSCRKENIVLHGEINGIVTNDITGDPIPGAVIKLDQTPYSATSGSDGKYILKNLLPGDYTISITSPGFKNSEKNVTVSSAVTKELDFKLTGAPEIDVHVKYLDFGLDSTQLSFTIGNSGHNNLIYYVHPSQDWIHVNKETDTVINNSIKIIVTIDKSRIAQKTYKDETLTISNLSQEGSKDKVIPVYLNGVMDQDTNYYNVTWIRNQIWMAENLKVGTLLPSSAAQSDNKIIEYYNYNDDRNNYSIYGGLYQWDEMMQYKPSDNGHIGTTRGVCPVGWHIPTNNEWITLRDALGGVAVAGGKLKSKDSPPWQPPNTGASNSSNFSALPGGLYGTFFTGELIFSLIGTNGVWWSSTLSVNDGAYAYTLWSDSTYMDQELPDMHSACSVRCVKDP